MSLHIIAEEQGAKRTDTTKLFWGQYGYSLKTLIPENFLEDRREACHQFWFQSKTSVWREIKPQLRDIHAAYRVVLQEHIDKIIDANTHTLSADDFYYLVSDKNVTFYVKTEEACSALLQSQPGVFHTYSAPKNAQVASLLQQYAGKKIEVSELGWYADFDHKIVFKWMRSYDDLDNRVKALCFNDSVYSEGSNRILYVKGDDDFFLAKLALNEHIESVTQRVHPDNVTD